ncbi:retrovirus-related pol polyprotein LINE-1 [Tanacetum coccineum]
MRAMIGTPRILRKNLYGDVVEPFRARVKEELSARVGDLIVSDADQMWASLSHIIKDAVKDAFGVDSGSTRTRSTHRESWWFSEEVQIKVAVKQNRFIELLLCWEGNHADRETPEERYKVYEGLNKKLDSIEGANNIYMIAKSREKRRRDVGNIKYIKDEEGRSIVRKRYHEKAGIVFLLSFDDMRPEGSREGENASQDLQFDCYYSRISQAKVRVTLKKMGRNKVVGPDQIPMEAWKCLGDEGIKWLNCLFNKIFQSAKMLDEWRLIEVIPIYKNKGDAEVCSNYKGINLLSHTMKLWERVIEISLRRETRVLEIQFGFMPGGSSIEAIHLLKSLMEKYRENQRDLHISFVDLEKAYDSVPYEFIWRTLIEKRTLRRYLRVIRDMYEGAKTRVRTIVGNTNYFPMEVGLYHGSAISPYLFALILYELS